MRVISWNLNGRVAKAKMQCEALMKREPDVVALQEITATTLPILRDQLVKHDFRYLIDSFSQLGTTTPLAGPRRYGLVIASQHPLDYQNHLTSSFVWPEKFLAGTLKQNGTQIDIFTTHVPPGSSNGWIKIEILEKIYQLLATHSRQPRILCGDFNTPQAETTTGEVITWGQSVDTHGRAAIFKTFRGGAGARWDTAERQVLVGLREFDLADMYRLLHGYAKQEFSWYTRRQGKLIGRRFDHVFASAQLQPARCEYLHTFREAGLSDHSAIEAVFQIVNERM